MSEELIKRLRTVARDEERAWGDEDEVVILLREAADALSRPAPVQVPEGYPDGFDASCGIPAEAMRAANALLADMKGIREWDVPCAAAHIAQFSAPAAPAVDAEKVMALALAYGHAIEQANAGFYGAMASEVVSEKYAQIRALLTPAIANQEQQCQRKCDARYCGDEGCCDEANQEAQDGR